MDESLIKPIAIPGIHQRFMPFFERITAGKKIKVLDVGAGHGAFTKKLFEEGYEMAACDMYPDYYHYSKVPCKQADLTKGLPYDDNSMDAIIAIEVMEHIQDHSIFFSECQRILRPGGKVLVSTPNILSLKSRVRFLFSGFFYSFKPLELENYDGLQHVAGLTLDQYNYVAIRHGFQPAEVGFDKKQNTSRWLMFLYPFLHIYTWIKKIKPSIHNTVGLLTGRVLFMSFEVKG
ncbi:class I SAM-dependent methyltransferase [bacterium]|nr:class I SAM-dependent methyltransferase [bacterium]